MASFAGVKLAPCFSSHRFSSPLVISSITLLL
jgi:hypothetical protein